jgi:hypothetical protein
MSRYVANAPRSESVEGVSPNGQRFLLLEDAPAPDGQKPAAAEIHLVQHWTEDLKARVPTK